MKNTFLFLILAALGTLQINAQTCQLKLFAYDQNNWKNISYGLMQGLYDSPPDNCPACVSFSTDVGLMNLGYVGLQLTATTWQNFNTWMTQNPFQIFGNLVSSTLLFVNFFTAVDRIYKNKQTMALPIMLFTMLQDKTQQDAIRANIMQRLEKIIILLGTLPGASCKSIGFRIGTTVRYVFNVAYDSPQITKFINMQD